MTREETENEPGMSDAYLWRGRIVAGLVMKRAIVLLTPVLAGVSAGLVTALLLYGGLTRIGSGYVFQWDQFQWSLFPSLTVFYVGAILFLSYVRTLADNAVDFVMRRKTNVRTRLLLLPLLMGVTLTLISGLTLVLLLPLTDRPHSALAYRLLYPWYLTWYHVPGPICQQYSLPARCQPEFYPYFFLWDTVALTGLFLLVSYASVLGYDVIPWSRRKLWPFFLAKPRPIRLQGPVKE